MFWSDKRGGGLKAARAGSINKPRHMQTKQNNIRESIDFVQHGAYMVMQKKEPHIITGSSSIMGKRFEQQDSYFVSGPAALTPFRLRRTLAVVCDGMGGLEAGDRASITAVEMLHFAFSKLPAKKVDIPHFFYDMLENIDYEINHWTDLKSDRGSGTTLVAAIVENRRLYWASVGDSSMFIIQDGVIKRITREHNYRMYLSELVSDGIISQQQADSDPQRSALVSYLGMGGISYIDIPSKPYVMKNGDILLLCSDGVTNTISEQELLKLVENNIDDMYGCCKSITKAVEDKNMEIQDNATVVVVQYVE